MKRHRLSDFKRGWFIGDFSPTLFKTKDFEVAVKFYKKGDQEAAHVHKIAHEYTIVGSGQFRMNKIELQAGDIIELAPGDVADFECLQDGQTFVVKVPSAPDDKEFVK